MKYTEEEKIMQEMAYFDDSFLKGEKKEKSLIYTAKEAINKMKRQPSEWKKIIANETTDKGLMYKIY